jgi:hypothetical protein
LTVYMTLVIPNILVAFAHGVLNWIKGSFIYKLQRCESPSDKTVKVAKGQNLFF